MSVEVTGVVKNSAAYCAGVRKGDMLVSVNGHGIRDVLDYMFYSAEQEIVLVLKRGDKHIALKIVKSEYDDLGMEFQSFLMDNKQSCTNKCVFCFIDQMPPGMRETLYFKDDDARLSFLQGNYVTLTNMKDEDIDRIIDMHLNVNISVHTTNPELRCKMMNNRFAGEKLKYLKRLADADIGMNCQIVLCPGLNDGDELKRSLDDLGKLAPAVKSVAVVPVGLTKFREGLYPLKLFDKDGAAETIRVIEEYQQKFLKDFGTRLVFPADEFYLTAGLPIPDNDYYEDYPQYENGVGMLRSLEDEFSRRMKEIDAIPHKLRNVSIATGAAAYEFISELARSAEEKYPGLSCCVYKIINNFFGDTITVTGLLTGQDLTEQLLGKKLGGTLLLSESMVMRGSDIFLDDMTVAQLEKKLNVKIKLTPQDGAKLFDNIVGISDTNSRL
ncbi:MAG: DUF512 domain-containing protein [Oscillospiraceae bacterium]|nr:DUF512 domain-containing protein [Oscillospiraceae bacterium]